MGMVRSKAFHKNDDNGSDGDSSDTSRIYVVPRELKVQLDLLNFTDAEISEVREAFCMFDKQRNGYISRKSFLGAMRSLGQNPTEDEYDDMLNQVDADRNGLIEFTEFLALVARISTNFEETAQYVFHVFDRKGSGFVPKHDLRDVLMLDKGGFDFNDVDDIMTCFRSDAKENINMEEFVRVMKYLPTSYEQISKPKTKLQPQEEDERAITHIKNT